MPHRTVSAATIPTPALPARGQAQAACGQSGYSAPAYVATWCEWRDAYAEPAAVARGERDRAEERSLAGAMAGLCLGWFVAGPAGALCGLLAGAWFGVR